MGKLTASRSKLLAAVSVLGLSVGMMPTQAADQNGQPDMSQQQKDSHQLKLDSNQYKESHQLKLDSAQHKLNSNQYKESNQLKLDSTQVKQNSSQMKLNSNQYKENATVSPGAKQGFNPQPDPPGDKANTGGSQQ